VKVLYLIKQPLTERDQERHGLDTFLRHGHDLTVLDMSDFFHPDLDNNRAYTHAQVSLRQVRDIPGLQAEAETMKESDLIIFQAQSYGISRATRMPLKMISDSETPYLIQMARTFPGTGPSPDANGFGGRVADYWSRARSMHPINSAISRAPIRWFGVRPADYVVHNCRVGRSRNSLIGARSRQIEAHCHDYDIYRREKERGIKPKDQAVMLDQYMPFLQEFGILGAAPLDPNTYYAGLRRLFDRIEDELGLPVVIAAHPRADYSDKSHLLGGRPIHYGKTARLVGESKLALAHTSVTTAYAVMFRKPVMLFATEAMVRRHPYQKRFFDSLPRELGTPLRFFDDPDSADLSDPFSIDEAAYDRYLATYIKAPGTPSKPYWDIVLDAVSGT
jgi:hypothetical protein